MILKTYIQLNYITCFSIGNEYDGIFYFLGTDIFASNSSIRFCKDLF